MSSALARSAEYDKRSMHADYDAAEEDAFYSSRTSLLRAVRIGRGVCVTIRRHVYRRRLSTAPCSSRVLLPCVERDLVLFGHHRPMYICWPMVARRVVILTESGFGCRQPSRPFYGTCSPSRELYMPAVVYHLHAGCACDNICASTRGLRYGIHMGNPVFYFFKFLYRTD